MFKRFYLGLAVFAIALPLSADQHKQTKAGQQQAGQKMTCGLPAHDAPACSLPAIQRAIEAGHEVIYLEIQESYDGYPFVFAHDTLNRVTGETGALRNHASNRLRNYTYAGTDHNLLTLDQALGAINGRARVVLNIRGTQHQEEFYNQIAQIIKMTGAEGNVTARTNVPAVVRALEGKVNLEPGDRRTDAGPAR